MPNGNRIKRGSAYNADTHGFMRLCNKKKTQKAKVFSLLLSAFNSKL